MKAKTIIKYLKKLFHRTFRRTYTFKLHSLTYNNHGEPISHFKIDGEIRAIKIPCSTIFNTALNYIYNIEPKDLLLIKSIYDKYLNEKFQITISETSRDNNYVLNVNDVNIALSGEQICTDIALLNNLSIKDVHKIISTTYFLKGYNDAKKIITKNTKNKNHTFPHKSSLIKIM